MQEPRDGDFVAYIESLQRESAARLAQQGAHIAGAAKPVPSAGEFPQPKAEAAPGPTPKQAAGPFARRDADAKTVKALVAGVVGLVFLLTWLGNSSPFAFILGAALLAYAIPRLLAAFRTGVVRSSRSAVDHVFDRSGPDRREDRR